MKNSMNYEDWLEKAHNDLMAAEAIFAYYEEPPTDTICYHCHQVGEKCFKAFVIAKMDKLLKNCIKIDKDFERFYDVAENLNRYYIDSKYPLGIPTLYPKEEAKTALDQARDLLNHTRKKLITENSSS